MAGSALMIGAGTALGAGQSYQWWDAEGSAAARYWIEDIALNEIMRRGVEVVEREIPPGPVEIFCRKVNIDRAPARLCRADRETAGVGEGVQNFHRRTGVSSVFI